MEWDRDALAAVERAPFFVRRMVRKKAEEFVANRGGSRVTLAAVRECKQSFLSDASTGLRGASQQTVTPMPQGEASDFPIAESELRAIERLTETNAGVDERFYTVRSCGGAVGCPLTLVEVAPLADAIARRIADSGISEYLRSSIRGPVLTHHKFRAAVAGCPNNCSEPQIKDFAVVAQAIPDRGSGECVDCGECVRACKEDAICLQGGPHIDRDKCLSCGRCEAACATEAIVSVRKGYQVLVGGKLGRHAQLAVPILDGVDEKTVLSALDACLALYLEHARGPERLGAVLNRIGYDSVLLRLGAKG